MEGEIVVYSTPRWTALWTSIQPGDLLTLSRVGVPLHHGMVEDRTDDGLILWIRDDLGERRLFHLYDECSFEVTGGGFASAAHLWAKDRRTLEGAAGSVGNGSSARNYRPAEPLLK